MKLSLSSIRVLSFAFAAGLALATTACGAAPDGEPSHEPASSNAVGDHAADSDSDAGHPSPSASASAAVTAPPAPTDPAVGGGGVPPHGPQPGGDGKPPHGETRQ